MRPTLSTQSRPKMNVIFHFPLHLSLIVLLEAIKNTLTSQVHPSIPESSITSTHFTSQSLLGAIKWFNNLAQEVSSGENATYAVADALQNVGMNFTAILYETRERILECDINVANQSLANEVTNKLFARLLLNLFSVRPCLSRRVRRMLTYPPRMLGW